MEYNLAFYLMEWKANLMLKTGAVETIGQDN